MAISPKEMIALVTEHQEAERLGDLERTMATLAPNPVYDMVPFGTHFEGEEATRNFYVELFAGGIEGFEYEQLGIWVNDSGVIREDYVQLHGLTEYFGFELQKPSDASFRTITVFPFEGDKIKGERSYFDRLFVLEQLGFAANLAIPSADSDG
jgi:SnoaL-like protein